MIVEGQPPVAAQELSKIFQGPIIAAGGFEPDTAEAAVANGATGYTGRFVIAELLRRGMTPIAIARDANALSAANFPENEVYRRQASLNDAASLDRALQEAQAVINCTGPFVDTADAVVSAALRAGIHYVDVAAEQVSAGQTLENLMSPLARPASRSFPRWHSSADILI